MTESFCADCSPVFGKIMSPSTRKARKTEAQRLRYLKWQRYCHGPGIKDYLRNKRKELARLESSFLLQELALKLEVAGAILISSAKKDLSNSEEKAHEAHHCSCKECQKQVRLEAIYLADLRGRDRNYL